MSKIKETIKSLRNDGSDPRKNDVWRILLFALNNSAGASLGQLMCRWNYYTQNVLQLGVFLTSINVFMVLIDAFTDPIVANIFDTFESKHGKFRPFMFTGCMMTILPAIVIFCYPVNSPLPHWATFTILIAMNILIVLGNTVLSTATRAGQAIITQDPKQRPIYSLGQTVFDAIVSGFVTIVVTSNLVGNMQETKVWRISVLVLSVISIILVFIAMKAIENRDNPTYYSMSKSDEKPKMSEFIYFIKRSKPFRCLFAATVSDNIASSIRYTLSIYLFANIIMNRSLSAPFEIISGALLGAPAILIGVYYASKKGSAVVYTKVSVVQTLISLAGFFLCLILLPPDPSYHYSGLSLSVVLVLLVFGLYMSSLGISTNLENAMIGDLTDYEYYKNGKFIPGTIGATLSFANKLITSVVGIIEAGIMIFCGFSGTGEAAVVPENVFVNYRFYYCVLISVFILPAIGHFITYVAMRHYPIDAEMMEKVSLFMAQERGVIPDNETETDTVASEASKTNSIKSQE